MSEQCCSSAVRGSGVWSRPVDLWIRHLDLSVSLIIARDDVFRDLLSPRVYWDVSADNTINSRQKHILQNFGFQNLYLYICFRSANTQHSSNKPFCIRMSVTDVQARVHLVTCLVKCWEFQLDCLTDCEPITNWRDERWSKETQLWITQNVC